MRTLLFSTFLLVGHLAFAQLVAGPMVGPPAYRSVQLWLLTEKNAGEAIVQYWPMASSTSEKADAKIIVQENYQFAEHNIVKYECRNLEPGTAYQYSVAVPGQNGVVRKTGSFKTLQLFQWRTDPPEVNFIAGSCNYVNQPPYDRPGKPYGQDSSIFESMAAENADLMLWLGDNWYTREIDYTTAHGLWYRAAHDRAIPVMQQLLATTPQLAIWDDHDYGPNDYANSYVFKEESRKVFEAFWLNPTSGMHQQGIFTRYQMGDIDFFLMDDRWWRSFDDLPDSVNGKPNPDKKMWGDLQLNWLKDELRISKRNPFVNFRIIATGSQVLNPVSPFDKMLNFPIEYYNFIDFLRNEKIDGVLFITGDRHHSEIIKVQPQGLYPLYDITSSPLTSGTHSFGGKEANNPFRVLGVDQLQNYTQIKVTGPRNNRKMTIIYKGIKGNELGRYSIEANTLRLPK